MQSTFTCILNKIKTGSCILDWRLARKNLGSCILAGGSHSDSDVNCAVLNTAVVCLDNVLFTIGL